MRICNQSSAKAMSPQDSDRFMRRPLRGNREKVAKQLASEKKERACRASQMKLFWVFQVQAPSNCVVRNV